MTISPLPSPWLSERCKAWRQIFSSRGADKIERPFDLLFVIDKLQLFPSTSTGAGVCRSDHLKEISALIRGIIEQAGNVGLQVLLKPFNELTLELMARTFRDLGPARDSVYRFVDTFDKGLTRELVDQCNVVLWDQPGTGFAECLVSGIPTLVCWPRIYYAEAPRARPFFERLESVGIIHQDPVSLFDEYRKFKSAPREWMTAPGRTEAISRFCRQYAWVSNDWARHWRRFLKRRS